MIVGIAGFGIVGLLHSYGVSPLPSSYKGLIAAIGKIGRHPHYCGLWLITSGGLVVGGGLIVFGSYRLNKKMPAERFNHILQTFEDASIKDSALSWIPPKETLDTNLGHDINILKRWFREANVNRFENEFNHMISKIAEKNQMLLEAYPKLPPSFYDDMTLYLRNIIEELLARPEKRKEVLSALAEAAYVCPPTWYECVKKQLKFLKYSHHSVKNQLLQWIQEIKEEIVLELAQTQFNEQWHGLNYVRFHVGEELGLNRENVTHDPFFAQKIEGQFSKAMMISLFKKNFTLERLVSALEIKVNAEYQPCFYDTMEAYLMNLGFEQKEAYAHIIEHFYQEDCTTINTKGIQFLLTIIGYIH